MSLVGRFEHLPNRPRSDEARPLLEKIASQVKPIMSKRSWKVGTLAEFLPSNPSLLGNNMNAGERINLRLRPPGSPSTFYEYDQLVLVMLHELTHIEHGPHDAKFYKLLAELEEEYWDLKRKGYSGEGFHGAGSHLSGFKVPPRIGKAKGLEAAQKRLDTQMRIGKGGVLGGKAVAGRSVREVLAEAAERRIRDDKACNTQDHGHAQEVEAEVRKAAEESVGIDAKDIEGFKEESEISGEIGSLDNPVVIDDDGDGNPPVTNTGVSLRTTPKSTPSSLAVVEDKPIPSTSLGSPKNGKSPTANSTGSKPSSSSSSLKPKAIKPTPSLNTQNVTIPSKYISSPNIHFNPVNKAPETLILPNGEWQCPTCTLLNDPLTQSCEACTTPRPRQSQKGAKFGDQVWFCEFCGSGPRDMGFWSCAECGWVRKWG